MEPDATSDSSDDEPNAETFENLNLDDLNGMFHMFIPFDFTLISMPSK